MDYWIFYEDEGLTQVFGGTSIKEAELYLGLEKQQHPDAYIMSDKAIFKLIEDEAIEHKRRLNE